MKKTETAMRSKNKLTNETVKILLQLRPGEVQLLIAIMNERGWEEKEVVTAVLVRDQLETCMDESWRAEWSNINLGMRESLASQAVL
jgi:hypothetical protein